MNKKRRTEEQELAKLVNSRALLVNLTSVREVPSSIHIDLTSNPLFDFFPTRAALSSFQYP